MNRQKFVLLFTVFIDMACFSMIFPVMPYFIKAINQPDYILGLVIAIFAGMNFLCSPFWGVLSDRKGRKPVMLLSIAITCASNILMAFSNNWPLLFIARMIGGIGSANISVAQAYMSDISTPQERTKNMGLIGAMFGLGFIFGPVFGPYLNQYNATASLFWVGIGAAALNLFNFISAFLFLKESNVKLDAEKRSINPIALISKWIEVPVIKNLMWLFFLYVIAFSLMQATSGLLWKEKYGLTDKDTGYLMAYIGITSFIFQGWLAGKLSKKIAAKKMIFTGASLMAIGLASLPLPPLKLFMPLELIPITLLSLGNALITPAVMSWLSRKAPETQTGQVLGANQSFSSLARVIGPPLGTTLFMTFHNLPFYLCGLIMLLPIAIIYKLRE